MYLYNRRPLQFIETIKRLYILTRRSSSEFILKMLKVVFKLLRSSLNSYRLWLCLQIILIFLIKFSLLFFYKHTFDKCINSNFRYTVNHILKSSIVAPILQKMFFVTLWHRFLIHLFLLQHHLFRILIFTQPSAREGGDAAMSLTISSSNPSS